MDQPLKAFKGALRRNNGYLGTFLKSALGITFGFLLGFLALRHTGISQAELFTTLASVDPLRIFLGMLGGFVLTCAQALRWKAVLSGVARVRFATLFQSKLVGYAANCILPARLGDLVRFEFVSTITKVSRSKILATGVVDIWFDKIGWVITFGIAYLMAPMPSWVMKAMGVMGGLIILIGVSLFMFSRLNFRQKLTAMLAGFREGLNHPHRARLFLKQFWISPLSWIWEGVLIIFVARAFGVHLNFSQAFAVITAINLSMVVPIPGNAGTFEVAGTYALTSFGVEPDRAVAFSLIYHLMLLIPGFTAGAVIFGVKTGRFRFFRSVRGPTQ